MNDKRFLTLFWYDDIGEQHLYKDVGGIPYALAKYRGWSSTFAFIDVNGEISNYKYEKYVKLLPIKNNVGNKYGKRLDVIKFLWNNINSYDVLNMYHCRKWTLMFCMIAKLRNPKIKTYIKLDAGRKACTDLQRYHIWDKLIRFVDVFTVETKSYVKELNAVSKFMNKVKYLPNGFFSDFLDSQNDIVSENIILTVARLGTYHKNTELLVDAFIKLDEHYRRDWKLYLVGPYTDDFFEYIQRTINKNNFIKDKIVLTGNISDKQKLYEIYAKAKVFVLPSRQESWGLVLNEAMYYKNYVIATDVCDAYYDFFFDGKEQLATLIRNDDIDMLVGELEAVLKNMYVHQQKAEKASVFINSNFNWEVVIRNLDEYLSR